MLRPAGPQYIVVLLSSLLDERAVAAKFEVLFGGFFRRASRAGHGQGVAPLVTMVHLARACTG